MKCWKLIMIGRRLCSWGTTRWKFLTKKDLHARHLKRRKAERTKEREENRNLKRKFAEKEITEEFLKRDDSRVKYYAGIPNYETFNVLLCHVIPFLPQGRRKLTPFQMTVVTLMFLRLDLPIQHIGHLLDMHRGTVSAAFHETLNVLYARLAPMVHWPDQDSLQVSMQHQFGETFGNRWSKNASIHKGSTTVGHRMLKKQDPLRTWGSMWKESLELYKTNTRYHLQKSQSIWLCRVKTRMSHCWTRLFWFIVHSQTCVQVLCCNVILIDDGAGPWGPGILILWLLSPSMVDILLVRKAHNGWESQCVGTTLGETEETQSHPTVPGASRWYNNQMHTGHQNIVRWSGPKLARRRSGSSLMKMPIPSLSQWPRLSSA